MKKNTTNPVTLQDIANTTGYSKNTVSLALRKSERLSKVTRSIIQQKAKQLGYRPNLIARNLATGKSGLIGIYTQSLNDSVRTEIVNGLVTELRSSQYCPVLGLGQGHQGPWHNCPWVKTLQLLNIEAMVVVREAVKRMPKWTKTIPTIMVSCQPKDSLKCDYVALDRCEAASLGIDYLTNKGHQNILICADKKSYFGLCCQDKLYQKKAFPFWPTPNFPVNTNNLNRLLGYVTKNRRNFSAIIFSDSQIAAEFSTMLIENNFAIPKDLAIISYDYLPYAKHLKVPLTTIQQPIEQLVSDAVKLIKHRLDNPASPYVHKILKHSILPGKSV